VESDAALLVVEDRDELESRAECFEVPAQRGHAYVVGVLNESFDSLNAERELAECERSVWRVQVIPTSRVRSQVSRARVPTTVPTSRGDPALQG